MRKLFTMSEVQVLLPVLESLMLRAQTAGRKAGELEQAVEGLRQKVFVTGGLQVDVAEVARQRAEQNAAIEQVKSVVSEVEEIGAHVHDLSEGMLDLPFRSGMGEVMLCWRLGEPMVTHWHGVEEGETERRPLSELFRDVAGEGGDRLN